MFRKLPLHKKVVIAISLGLLVISLTQPAFYTANDKPSSFNLCSAGLFFLGWMGALAGAIMEFFFWFANPLYLIALYRFVKGKKNPLIASISATLIAASFSLSNTFIANEAGGRTIIIKLGIGYGLWVASLCVLTIGVIWCNGINFNLSKEFEQPSLQSEHSKLITLLEKAEQLAREFTGGYSNQFLSAEEFHQALSDSINKLKQGDKTQLDKLNFWFGPTSCWDDFVGSDGQDLANEISGLLSKLTK